MRTMKQPAARFGNGRDRSRPKNLGCLMTLTAMALLFTPPLQSQVYKFGHCLLGCPQGAAPSNHTLVRSIYTLSFNTTTKTADWVAYQVTAGSIGIASSLSRELVADDFVADTLEEADFFAIQEQGLVRAQYAPLISFAATPYWSEVNYSTNAVVRTSSLSQGAWYGLDWAVRNLVNREAAVYVVTGPVFYPEAEPRTLDTDKQHRIPDGFFKVVLTREGRAAAFLFPQDTAVHMHHCDLRSSLPEIERLTGLELFPDGKSRLDLALYSALGCSA